MSDGVKITDNVLTGGYDLMDLKDKLVEINDNLDLLAKNEETTNLYDSKSIGIIVYDTPYEKTEDINSEGIGAKFTNAKELLLEYINPTKREFVLNYIQRTGNFKKEIWEELNVKFENEGALPGKLIGENKELNNEFLGRLQKYYNAYRDLESKSGRIVGIYKNNGEETASDSPKNLIGFSYISNLDFSEPSEMYNFLHDIIANGISAVSVNSIKDKLSETGAEMFEDVVSALINLNDVSKLTSDNISAQKKILVEGIDDLYGSENLSGLTDSEMIGLKTLKFVSNYISGKILGPNPAVLLSIGVSCIIESVYRLCQTCESTENGIRELNRMKDIESLSKIFEGQSGDKEFRVSENSNFQDICGDSLSKNTIIGDDKGNFLQALALEN